MSIIGYMHIMLHSKMPKQLEWNMQLLILVTMPMQLRILQRKLSRQKKGSNSREKTKEQIRKLYKKVTNQRLDFLHKISTELSNTYSAIYMEDLNLQKMQSSGLTNVNRKMVDNGFLKQANQEMLILSDDIDDLIDKMKNYKAPAFGKWINKSEI